MVWQRAERMPPRLIDTQIAAALLGWPPQVGLEGLLMRTLNVELGESYARTDWSRRPLPPEALNYAIEDVHYLLRAWDELEKQLAALGRLSWLHEDCARTLAEPPVADATAVWSRLKGMHALSFPAACAALELVRWRERAAQRSDRPRRWLLDDDSLLALAARAAALDRGAAGARVAEIRGPQWRGHRRGRRAARRRRRASNRARASRAAGGSQDAESAARGGAPARRTCSESSPKSSQLGASSPRSRQAIRRRI